MKEMAFLPEYNVMPSGNMYVPIYRLFENDRWRKVMECKKPMKCATATEAMSVAKEKVKAILNRPIRAETMAPDGDDLGVREWLEGREARHRVEIENAFGNTKAKTVFLRKGKQVSVERKRKRGKK